MEQTINAIRFLGIDAVNEANSGHPGIVLGAAPMIYSLFTKHMEVTPNHPDWFDRDRFVLSAGHGSALLYSTLHLSGFAVSIDDIKDFRQLESITPGHPEYGHTEGIEATTGPLGQGIGNAVGMAIAEANLRARYNTNTHNIIDHFTYVLCGDGDLQEGVTQEAMSLAGHLGLGRLIILYDSNDIQLDGPVKWANSEDVKAKYEAMNWQYLNVLDANNLDALNEAINIAKGVTDHPTIIEVKSVIGYGSKDAGKSATHGAPLGIEEVAAMRKRMNYNYKPFEVPKSAYDFFKENTIKRGDSAYNNWEKRFEEYRQASPKKAKELQQIIDGEIDFDFDNVLPIHDVGTKEATRVSSGRALTLLGEALPSLIGGSADLSKSTKAKGVGGNFEFESPAGRNINFGVREHAMAAIVNGLTLHGLRGFSGGFFVFSDYMKPAIRLAALSKIPSLFVFTHDSVAVGEDGPTHEPIEQLSMFRTMPYINVWRPADANETQFAYRAALETSDRPSMVVCTRQNVTVKTKTSYDDVKKGAYVISDEEDFEGILIATGSEVNLALDAQEQLKKEGILVRVVSMPCMELFEQMSDEYKENVLPSECKKRLAIELGSPHVWYRYANDVMGLTRFGMSAPGDEVVNYFGFTTKNVVKKYKAL